MGQAFPSDSGDTHTHFSHRENSFSPVSLLPWRQESARGCKEGGSRGVCGKDLLRIRAFKRTTLSSSPGWLQGTEGQPSAQGAWKASGQCSPGAEPGAGACFCSQAPPHPPTLPGKGGCRTTPTFWASDCPALRSRGDLTLPGPAFGRKRLWVLWVLTLLLLSTPSPQGSFAVCRKAAGSVLAATAHSVTLHERPPQPANAPTMVAKKQHGAGGSWSAQQCVSSSTTREGGRKRRQRRQNNLHCGHP